MRARAAAAAAAAAPDARHPSAAAAPAASETRPAAAARSAESSRGTARRQWWRPAAGIRGRPATETTAWRRGAAVELEQSAEGAALQGATARYKGTIGHSGVSGDALGGFVAPSRPALGPPPRSHLLRAKSLCRAGAAGG